MNQESPSPNQGTMMTAMETWTKALTKPNLETYQQIANDPGASMGKAILWLLGFGFVGSLINGLLGLVFNASMFRQFGQMFSEYDIPFGAPAAGIGSVILGAFTGPIFTVIGSLIFVGLIHLVSGMLKGAGSFNKFFYAVAAFVAPLGMVTSILSAIPFIGWLSTLLGLYGLFLYVLANQAAYGYDVGKAVIAVLAPGLVIALFCCCLIVLFGGAIASLMGPSIEGVFEGIQSSLTP